MTRSDREQIIVYRSPSYRLTVASKYEEVEPDELDLKMIAEVEKEALQRGER